MDAYATRGRGLRHIGNPPRRARVVNVHGVAGDCIDTGKGFCTPVLYWYSFWAGAVVGSVILTGYWLFRSRRFDRLAACKLVYFLWFNRYRDSHWCRCPISLAGDRPSV